MGVVSRQISEYQAKSSWIRKMFEAGAALKAEFGEDAVCDFSLGNPDLPPPPIVAQGLRDLADTAHLPLAFGYMPNAGYPWAKKALAEYVSREQEIEVGENDVMVACGAAGGLNAIFRTVLDPGDEVLGMAPYFVEYGFYTENYAGVFKSVPCKPLTFELDLKAIESAINPKTKVVLINSPNNPTGQVYSSQSLQGLADILTRKSKEFGRPILLIADEPYRFLTFDGVVSPPVLPLYPYSVLVSSFSKNLSLAGVRIGYAAVSPNMPDKADFMGGLVLSNRILGFVNAPAIGQALAVKSLGATVEVEAYAARRKAMAEVLDQAGYEYAMPKGAFYFFPKAPGGDDVAFVQTLQEEKILAVPGQGFGYPGYFRLAFCVDEAIIRRSAPGFARAIEKY